MAPEGRDGNDNGRDGDNVIKVTFGSGASPRSDQEPPGKLIEVPDLRKAMERRKRKQTTSPEAIQAARNEIDRVKFSLAEYRRQFIQGAVWLFLKKLEPAEADIAERSTQIAKTEAGGQIKNDLLRIRGEKIRLYFGLVRKFLIRDLPPWLQKLNDEFKAVCAIPKATLAAISDSELTLRDNKEDLKRLARFKERMEETLAIGTAPGAVIRATKSFLVASGEEVESIKPPDPDEE